MTSRRPMDSASRAWRRIDLSDKQIPFQRPAAAFYNVAGKSIGPDWSVKAKIGLLLPKAIFQ